MLRLRTQRIAGRCPVHRRYNPESGPGAIKGGCKHCDLLLEIYQTAQKLHRLVKKLESEGKP